MRNRAAPLLIFAGLWLVYAAIGQWLADQAGFLSRDAAIISARAILATGGDPLTLASLGVPQPPLAFLAALPFAALGLANPAIWASAALGAFLTAWFFTWFREDARRTPLLALLILAVPFVPGVFHDATVGAAGLGAIVLLTLATHLASRFALEQQTTRERHAEGRLSAWGNPDRDQAHAIRFLWAAALLLGLACCARSDLFLALPIFLLVTPFLLPRSDRTQPRKIATIALLLYLPMIALHLTGGVLSWSFNGDFLRGLRHPLTALETLDLSARLDALRLTHPAAAAGHVFTSLLAACPLLIYVVARLRNVAVALLCAIPFLVETVAVATGRSLLTNDLYALATLFTITLLLIGARLQRFARAELVALVVLTLGSVVLAWPAFSSSPAAEERVWRSLAGGQPVRTYAAERELAAEITRRDARDILLDQSRGLVFITLLNSPAPFILAHEARFRFALENPQLAARNALLRADGGTDAVALAWTALQPAKAAAFIPVAGNAGWTLLGRAPTAVTAR